MLQLLLVDLCDALSACPVSLSTSYAASLVTRKHLICKHCLNEVIFIKSLELREEEFYFLWNKVEWGERGGRGEEEVATLSLRS